MPLGNWSQIDTVYPTGQQTTITFSATDLAPNGTEYYFRVS